MLEGRCCFVIEISREDMRVSVVVEREVQIIQINISENEGRSCVWMLVLTNSFLFFSIFRLSLMMPFVRC